MLGKKRGTLTLHLLRGCRSEGKPHTQTACRRHKERRRTERRTKIMTKAEMKQLVRENFKEDRNNELLGFLEVENTIEADYPADYTQEGATLVYYRAHTGEITCELLDDMVGFILDKKEWEED